MTRWLLSLELIDSPMLAGAGILAALLVFVVVLARPRHPFVSGLVAVVAFVLAYAGFRIAELADVFSGPLPAGAATWGASGIAMASIGVVELFARPWWRRILAVVLVLLSLLVAGLGVNRAYGITHSLGAIVGVQTIDGGDLPDRDAEKVDPATLYQTWTPPASMPATGRVTALTGAEQIPATSFAARPAALYLPPAALVEHPPELPLLVFMMGQPGSPDPKSLTTALEAFAAAHDGLAPIAIVADQLTAPDLDPVCQDSARYGKVSTYFNTDIPAFAREKLNIVDDPRYWVIGGYSNGGACALKWGAEYPQVWGNLIDISGNEYPGSETVDQTIATVFGGSAAAFEAAKPTSIMTQHPGAYGGHVAVFTRGGDDGMFGPGVDADAAAAKAAGFTVIAASIPGAGHVGPALDQGLARAVDAIGPVLGLAPPR